MAKKEISGYVKLQIKGGQANPAPPVGPALGQRGINIMEFCKAYNEKTKSFMGKPVPVVITVYKDKKFDFVIKSPPASHFIREAAKLKSGSKEPGRVIAGSITIKQAEAIAKEKMKDLNAFDLKEAKGPSQTFTFSPISKLMPVFWLIALSETCPNILFISLSEIGVGLSEEPKKPLTFCKFLIRW